MNLSDEKNVKNESSSSSKESKNNVDDYYMNSLSAVTSSDSKGLSKVKQFFDQVKSGVSQGKKKTFS